MPRTILIINTLFVWLLFFSMLSFSGLMAGQVVSEMEFKQRVLPRSKTKKTKLKPVYFMKKSHIQRR